MKTLKVYFMLVLGAIIAAVGLDFFLVPHRLVTGGLSGIGTILFFLSNRAIPIGLTVFVLNIPIFVLGYRMIGKKFIFRSIIGMIVFTASIDVIAPYAQWIIDEFLLIKGEDFNILIFSVYGGILVGIGLGMVIRQGATTGGTDMLATLLHRWLPKLSIASYIAILDGIIIIAASVVFNSIILGLYSIFSMYLTSKAIDLIVEGARYARVFMIISDHSDTIAKELRLTLDRGVTFLEGIGAHLGERKKIIYCVAYKNQTIKLQGMVNNIDPNAFVTVIDARNVFGNGFDETR